MAILLSEIFLSNKYFADTPLFCAIFDPHNIIYIRAMKLSICNSINNRKIQMQRERKKEEKRRTLTKERCRRRAAYVQHDSPTWLSYLPSPAHLAPTLLEHVRTSMQLNLSATRSKGLDEKTEILTHSRLLSSLDFAQYSIILAYLGW